jgi:hypothetical protein
VGVEDGTAGGVAVAAGGEVLLVGGDDGFGEFLGVGDGVAAGPSSGAGGGSGLFVDEGAGAPEHVVAELAYPLPGVDGAVLDGATKLGQVVAEPLQDVAVRLRRWIVTIRYTR